MEEIETSKIITADSPEGQIAVKTFCEEYNRAKISEERAGYLNKENNPVFSSSLFEVIVKLSSKEHESFKFEYKDIRKEIETSKIITADSPEGQIAVKTFCEEYNRAKISEERAGYLNRMNHRLFAFSIGLCIRNSSHYIPNYEEAREILGNDFISPEELKIKKSQRWFDYSQKQLSFFRGSIPSKSVLEFGRKYDYILFPGPGWDMDTARILFVNSAGKKDSFGYVNNWVEIRDFTVGPRWYMMRKYPVPGSDSVKYYSSMENLISKHEFIPNLAMVMWGITTYAIARNINLFNDFEIVTHMQPFCIPYITLINGNKGLYIGENYSEAINRYPASWNKKTVLTSFVRL